MTARELLENLAADIAGGAGADFMSAFCTKKSTASPFLQENSSHICNEARQVDAIECETLEALYW